MSYESIMSNYLNKIRAKRDEFIKFDSSLKDKTDMEIFDEFWSFSYLGSGDFNRQKESLEKTVRYADLPSELQVLID